MSAMGFLLVAAILLALLVVIQQYQIDKLQHGARLSAQLFILLVGQLASVVDQGEHHQEILQRMADEFHHPEWIATKGGEGSAESS